MNFGNEPSQLSQRHSQITTKNYTVGRYEIIAVSFWYVFPGALAYETSIEQSKIP